MIGSIYFAFLSSFLKARDVPTSQLGPDAHVFFVFGGALGIAGRESVGRLFTVRFIELLFQTY
jgi:hypothetical protein